MNEQDKAMQYCFYAGVLVFFVFAMCYFGSRGNTDTAGSAGVGHGIDASQTLNTELQRQNQGIEQKVNDSAREVSGAIQTLGDAEADLANAERAINRCESILEAAKRRTQETNTQNR